MSEEEWADRGKEEIRNEREIGSTYRVARRRPALILLQLFLLFLGAWPRVTGPGGSTDAVARALLVGVLGVCGINMVCDVLQPLFVSEHAAP